VRAADQASVDSHPARTVTARERRMVPVTMTNVTTDDFLVASDSLQANDLNITSG
jgi:hypothetical protein